jgi:hypothetical protein
MKHRKFWLGCILLLLVLIWAAPALAAPAMTITPVWRPGEQLSSAPSDTRYVDVELMLNGNAQFWAVNIACAFTPVTVLDTPVITWGPGWGNEGLDFVPVYPNNDPAQGYNPATGTLNLRATRLGNVPPMGVNTDYTTLLATVRLRVSDTVTATTAAAVRCSAMEFLNRDGRLIVRGRQGRTANLTVRPGYTISGQALLQGGTNHIGTQVACTHVNSATTYTTTTTSAGQFVFGTGGPAIREFGLYTCTFTSRLLSPQAEFLDAEVELLLSTPTMTLLPVILKGGNVATGGGTENDIDDADLAAFTSGWAPGTVPTAYAGLDVNGDLRVNEADLAILAGNYDPQATLFNVDASHILYGLATDYGGVFPNSRVYWGDPKAGPVQRFEDPRRERDFWPTMSPDGSRVAYVRTVSKTNQYVLMVSPTAKPRGAQITPRNFNRQAFAPSWSPDGQRIAFICSWLDRTTGYEFNEGDVCIIDAAGSNLQTVATNSKIYPPAWYDNNVLIYAARDNHPNIACRNTLCFVDLATNTTGVVASLLGDANDVADMPTIGQYREGGTLRQALLYRFNDGSNTSIRVRRINNYAGTVFNLDAVVTIATPSQVSYAIDYYDASPFLDIIYYESVIELTPLGQAFRTIDTFYNRSFTVNGALSSDDWAAAITHTVDGFVGNPVFQSGLGGFGSEGALWNGSTIIPTRHHVQRATFDWIP